MVLTALKCDLRKDEDENENPNAITFEQGLAKAKEIGAVKYLGRSFCVTVFLSRGIYFLLANNTHNFMLECSAVQNRGIRETFYEAAKVALEVRPAGSKRSSSACIIL